MGSGTTGYMALNLKRNFIGCEINKDYYKMANESISIAQDYRQIYK